ncbi:dihydrofolate reductase [Patescibacteria group bacterium]|nr:dihydrofolate reductase [Patescibacteria group bacterium]
MLSIIAALDNKRGIGRKNQLPWHISEDLKRFKELTKGHNVIMGRNTFESIGKPLLERTNIVMTSDPNFSAEGVTIVNSIEEALDKAGHGDVFVIGGAQVFNLTISLADKLYLTLIEGDFGCDTFFPDYSNFTKEKFIGAGVTEDGLRYKFVELEKE